LSYDIAEPKRAEQAVKEALFISKDQHKELADQKFALDQHAIVAVTDVQGTITYVNDKFCAISQYSKDELIGQNHRILNSGHHPREFFEQMYHTIANGKVWHGEIKNRAKDGSIYWVDATIVPFVGVDGKPRQYVAIRTDITESKLAAEALVRQALELSRQTEELTQSRQALETQTLLLQSEARYRGLLEAAPDAMVVVNQAGEIVLVNVQAEKQFGYRRDELVGQKVKNIIPDGFAERLISDGMRSAAEARAQQIDTGIELSGRRRDGSQFPIDIMLSPLESAEGILVTAAIRDITEKKLAQEETQQQQHLLQLIIESIADGVVVADCSGKFLLFNTAAKRCLGIGATNTDPDQWSEQYGAYLPDAVTPYPSDDLPLVRALRGENVESTEVFIRNAEVPDGRLLDITGGPLRDEGGSLRGGVVVFHDITERKKSEDHLVKTVGELKRSNEELQQFAYISSHDLQEPLRMVASYTQLLARRYKGRLDSDADEFIAFAVDGCNRMQGLIQDLLAYSRSGTNGKALCDVSGEDALQGALTNLRITIGQSGAVVTHDPLPSITTDETQLTQVFQNLVGNAIKYRSDETPRVHVSATKNGDTEWIFSVRDNGLGIDPQYFERIFILFQRLHGRHEFGGTGIGLAICKKVLERLGGRIWVESQPEKGSTFYFALPEGAEQL